MLPPLFGELLGVEESGALPPASVPWAATSVSIAHGGNIPSDYHYGLSVRLQDRWVPQTSLEALESARPGWAEETGEPARWFVADGKFWLHPVYTSPVTLNYVPVGGTWPALTKWMVGCWHAWQHYIAHGPNYSRHKAAVFRARYEWWRRVVEGAWYKTWSGHRARRR